jgi:hypothetical protein
VNVQSDAVRAGEPAVAVVPVLPMPVMLAVPLAAGAAPASASGAAMPAASTPAHDEPGSPVPQAPASRAPAASTDVSTDAAPLADVQRVRAAYRAGEGASATPLEAEAAARRAEAAAAVRHGAAATLPSAPPQPAEMIHPQAATVVHQQLDLLATAVFRWSGQAWPEVPMEWSIQQEEGRPRDEGAQQEEARRWSTTVSLDLPRLGALELRLTLVGGAIQAQVVAGHATTVGRLRAHGGALEERFESAGLRLEGLRVSEAS